MILFLKVCHIIKDVVMTVHADWVENARNLSLFGGMISTQLSAIIL